MSELARDLRNAVCFLTCVRAWIWGEQNCMSLPQHHKQTLQGAAAAAGSLIPTAREAHLPSRRAREAAGYKLLSPEPWNVCAQAPRTWRCSGEEGARGWGCTAWSRALKTQRGLRQSWLYIPLRSRTDSRSSCAQRAPFTWWGRVGGPGWGQHIWSPCLSFPKELLALPVLPMQRDYRNVSELQVSFLFPQKKTGRHSH